MDSHEITGTIKQAEGTVEKGYGQLKDRARNAAREWDEPADEATGRFATAWEDATELVREHPAQSIGIAVLVGFALGSVISLAARD